LAGEDDSKGAGEGAEEITEEYWENSIFFSFGQSRKGGAGFNYIFGNQDTQTEGEEEVVVDESRAPVTFTLRDFTQNGLLKLKFSEELLPIESYKKQGLNLTVLNLFIKRVIALDYFCLGVSTSSEPG
jgi:hypothetical protein